MSDYSQTTDFSAKDALTSGDPAKAVKGSDIDAEFDAISVAILSKYDSSDLASQSEAEAGTSNAKLVTPLSASQLLASVVTAEARVKAAAETVNNSSTLQNDDDLAGYTIASSGVYRVTGILVVQIKAASDIKLCLTLGSAPTAINISFAASTEGGTQARDVQTASGTAVALTTTANEVMVIQVDGIIQNDTDATTATLQWAQNSAQSENTVLSIGSFLAFDRLS